MKYVIYEHQKMKYLVPIEKASYIPAGWRKPYTAYAFGDWSMKKPILHPAEKLKARVSLPGINTWANNVRIVDDKTANEIDDIEKQINDLKMKRQQLIYDKFLTLRLVEENDLHLCGYEHIYPTKKEAEEAYKDGKR